MRIEVYRATDVEDVPELLFAELDSLDDRFLAAFYNYPESEKLVIAAWATTGEIKGEVLAALVATTGHIITGYVDTYIDEDVVDEDVVADENEEIVPIEHDEPNHTQRRRALLARLRQVSKATWLLIHDADEVEGWTEQGFRVIDPPPDVPENQAVRVLAWGSLPEDVYALMRTRGLSWHGGTHRHNQG